MDDQWIARLVEVSFPVAVSAFLLVRLERALADVSLMLRDLVADLRELRAELRADRALLAREQRDERAA